MSDETAALRIEVIDASIAQAFTRQGCQRADKDDKKVVKKGVKKERRGLKMVAVEQGKSEDGAPSTPPPSRQPAKRARASSSPTKTGGESPLKQAGRASQQASTIKFEGRVEDPSAITFLSGGNPRGRASSCTMRARRAILWVIAPHSWTPRARVLHDHMVSRTA